MTTTLTYKEKYAYWEAHDAGLITDKIENEIEFEVMRILIGGDINSKTLILNHTNSNMFTEKPLQAVYKIVEKYVKNYGIDTLDYYNLIDKLEGKEIMYTKLIWELNRWFTDNARCENWIMRLQNCYTKRMEKQCNSFTSFEELKKELDVLKLHDTEISPFKVVAQYINDYEDEAAGLIKTSYISIDNLIGGLQGGNLLILAGAAGMGKTVMALNIITRMIKDKKHILFFSLEMNPEELINRICASESEINSERLRNRTLTDEELDKYHAYIATREFENINSHLVIHNKASVSIAEIEEISRKSNADLICIDYLGLIKSDKNKQNTYEEISDISRRLKLLANETNKPIMLLHQLNRDAKNRQDKRPTLSDIRDSGKIEQDADIIAFVYRPSYYDNKQNKRIFNVIIAKSRHTGGAGKEATLFFNGDYQKITEFK